jgi:hypothetical protein
MGSEHVRGEREAGELRKIALGILEHAKNDPEYLDRLKNDPEATLAAEGLTSPETRQLIGEFNLAEVQGYDQGVVCEWTCNYSCNTGTCQVTLCAYVPVTGGVNETR